MPELYFFWYNFMFLCVCFVMICLMMAVRPKHVKWLSKKGVFVTIQQLCLFLLTDQSILKINICCTFTTQQ